MAVAEQRYRRRASDRDHGWRQVRATLRIVLVVVAVAGVLWLIVQLKTIILLVVLSILFAYLIAPLVNLAGRPFVVRGRQRRLSKGLSVGVVYVMLLGLLTIAVAWLVPRLTQQASQMASQAPAYLQAVQGSGDSLSARLDRLGLSPDSRKAVEDALSTLGRSAEEAVRRSLLGFVGLLGYLPWLVLIPILAFFLVKDAESFREAAICLLPEGRVRANGVQLFGRINAALAAYIRAQLLACVIIGAAVTIGFAVLGVPYGLVLGALAGLAEFVPLVGPFVIALAAVALAAIHSPVLAIWVLVFLAVVRILEDYVVYPRLVGRVVDMHPLAVVVAVLAGAELGGVAGIFLSVPVVAILSAAYRQYLAYSRGRTATNASAGGTMIAGPAGSSPNP